MVSDLPKLRNEGTHAAMPRHPHIHALGLLYHLMTHGNNGQAVFLDPADYDAFLTALQTTREHYPFSLSAYVLMPNISICCSRWGQRQQGV